MKYAEFSGNQTYGFWPGPKVCTTMAQNLYINTSLKGNDFACLCAPGNYRSWVDPST